MTYANFECSFKINTQLYRMVIQPLAQLDLQQIPHRFHIFLNGVPFGNIFRREKAWCAEEERPGYLVEAIGHAIERFFSKA